MNTPLTLSDIDHCEVEIIDEILGTHKVFEIPTTVAEASHNCFEVEAARFYLKWFGHDDDPIVFNDEDRTPEPLSVSIVKRPDSVTVRWFATGPTELAVERRREIINGQWLRKGVEDED